MNTRKTLDIGLGIFFFGSLWGFMEASFGDWLYSHEIAHSSIYLTAIAIAILALSKTLYPYRWTGTLIGTIALFFKLVNVPFFACHLLAIFLLGFGFDIAYEFITRLFHGMYRLSLIGLFGTYVSRALFAFLITYVIRYKYWTAVGLPKVIDYIFISGSISALIGAVVVPILTFLGKRFTAISLPRRHTRFSTAAVLTATLGIWILQKAI